LQAVAVAAVMLAVVALAVAVAGRVDTEHLLVPLAAALRQRVR
jgi:hypothetical protein